MKELAYGAAWAAGLAALARRWASSRLLIVCYHGLTNDDSPTSDWLLLPLRRFRSQLDFLRRVYQVLPLDTAVERLRSGAIDRPSACITFDDGYANNLALGLPELQARRLPATIFLTTGLVGTRRRLWTSELGEALQDPRNSLPPRLPGGLNWPEPTPGALVAQLKALPAAERRAIVQQLMGQFRHPPSPASDANRFLTWEEVECCPEDSGITFGAHTVNHEIVSRLDDRELEMEVNDSLAEVARHVARPSRMFVYPNGTEDDIDERAAAVLSRAGCTGALTTIEGLNGGMDDPFMLRRVVVNPGLGMGDFAVRSTGAIAWLKRARGDWGFGKSRESIQAGSPPVHEPSSGQAGESRARRR